MVYAPAAPVIPRFVNVATPAVAFAVSVPFNVKPAEPAVIAAVMMALADEPAATVNELTSWIVIVGCELRAPPLVPVVDGRLVASFVATLSAHCAVKVTADAPIT
jgi:hypothetical protein